MTNYLKNLSDMIKSDGLTAKSFNALVKNKLDKTLHDSCDETLKEVVKESGHAASGGIAHALAMTQQLVESGVISDEDETAQKNAFRVILATENASAWAQRAGLRVDSDSKDDSAMVSKYQ